jgi:hypothetical protein
MFGQNPFANPYSQPIGTQGPISPLLPQQVGGQMGQPPFGFGPAVNPMGQIGQFGADPFGFGGTGYGALPPQGWQQRDPRAELLSNTIANITATRDPRVEYLAQIVTHPLVASNPVLKDLVARELLTTALEQVTFKSTAQNPIYAQGTAQAGFGQGMDPYAAAAIKSQVLAELAKSQAAQLARGGHSQWGSQGSPFGFGF